MSDTHRIGTLGTTRGNAPTNRLRAPYTLPDDWTRSEAGYSNDSEKYHELVAEVERLIFDSAHSLIRGDARAVARMIISHLAHTHGMAPPDS